MPHLNLANAGTFSFRNIVHCDPSTVVRVIDPVKESEGDTSTGRAAVIAQSQQKGSDLITMCTIGSLKERANAITEIG